MKTWQKCISNKHIIIILSIIFFIVSFIFFRHHFSIFYFQNDVGKIAVNIESSDIGDINICFDKTCDKMEYLKGVYCYELNQQNPLFYNNAPKSLEIISKDNKFRDKIEAISIFYNLNKLLYYTKNDFQKTDLSEVDFNGEVMYSYDISLNGVSDKTILQKIAVYFEGIFYNWYFYLISYILILIYLYKYQDRFNFEIKNAILFILLLAFLLRLSHIEYIPFWNDELYTCCYISDMGKGLNLDRIMLDPGNPPLFFILSNIWLMFFNKSVIAIRMLPCLIGLVQVYSIYFVINKIFNHKTALICAFLSAINIVIILESNEIRSYILSMTLVLWSLYWFYKLRNNFTKKYLIIYTIISVLLINIHYYCIFYVLANFILGIYLFKGNRKNFIIANFVAFITFIPYFIKTVINSSLEAGFNTWIEKPSIEMINNHITFYFGNVYWLILIALFSLFAFKIMQKKEKEIFCYIVYSISFVFLSAFLISIFIKPVLFERYFIIFLPFLIINTAIFLLLDFKTKFKPVLVCLILLVSINAPKYENFNLFSNISQMVMYSYLDSEANKDKYKTYFVIPDVVEYTKYFPYLQKEKIVVSKYGMLDDEFVVEKILNDIDDKTSKKILYFPESTFNFMLRQSKKLNVRKIETTIMRVYKVYIN